MASGHGGARVAVQARLQSVSRSARAWMQGLGRPSELNAVSDQPYCARSDVLRWEAVRPSQLAAASGAVADSQIPSRTQVLGPWGKAIGHTAKGTLDWVRVPAKAGDD